MIPGTSTHIRLEWRDPTTDRLGRRANQARTTSGAVVQRTPTRGCPDRRGRGNPALATPPARAMSSRTRNVTSTSAAPRPPGGTSQPEVTGVDLYWLPLGAGGHSVRLNGIMYEAVIARLERRRRYDLYHSALEISVANGRFVIEMTPVRAADGAERDVVAPVPWAPVGQDGFASFATRSGAGATALSPTWPRQWTAPAASSAIQ
jgi:hypothetical protein